MNELALETINLDNQLIQNQNLEKEQQSFLESTLGKTINYAIDIGIKAVLPDLIEDEIINIKDAIITNGFKDGIKEVINSAINTGKSAIGIVTGEFENTTQIEMAVKRGGILDQTSKLLDTTIALASKNNLINKDVSGLLKTGKNKIIDTVSSRIEKTMLNQTKAVEKLENQCEKWQKAFEEKDIKQMENAIKNIQNNLNKIVPLENIINKARTIETIHEIVENTGSFDISQETVKLAEKFS